MFLRIVRASITHVTAAARWLAGGGRWKVAAGVITTLAVAAALTLTLIKLRSVQRENTELSESLEAAKGEVDLLRKARTADAAAVTQRDAARIIIYKEEEAGRAKTEAALAANPDWANQPVPAAVLDSLRE